MKFIEDIENNYPLLLSSYGANLALGFKGDPDFIERCYNWAVNTGVVSRGGRLTWYYERFTGRLAYVCPKDEAKIKEGLALQFRYEIMKDREIMPLRDELDENEEPQLVWDEKKLDQMAAARADQFMQDHVIKDDFVLNRVRSVANIYEESSGGQRVEQVDE